MHPRICLSLTGVLCLQAGLKTLAVICLWHVHILDSSHLIHEQVWHRCLNSGDNTFIQLCAQYVHVLEPPAQNPLALMYGSYIRELLQAFAKCNHAYQRETDYEESKILKLSQVVQFHVQPICANFPLN